PRSSDYDGCGGDGEREVEGHEHATSGGADDRRASALPCQTATKGREISVEPHDRSRRVDRHCGSSDFVGARERVTTAADIERPPHRAYEPTARFPNDSVGELSLDLKTFLTLHPGIDRLKNLARLTRYGAARAHASAAEQLGRDATLVRRQSHTRTLFREGLTKVLRGQPHFLSELE